MGHGAGLSAGPCFTKNTMAKRFHSTDLVSIDGVEYDVEIWDSSFGGASTAFKTGQDGFTLTYEGDSGKIYTPLLPSQVSFTIESEPGNISAIQSFISDLLTAEEKRFQILIKKGGNTFWFGNVLNDISRWADVSYQSFQVIATDGLGALKEVDYNNAGVAYSGSDVAMEHFVKALSKIGTLDTFFASGDHALTTVMNWYEDSHTTGTTEDALKKTRLKHAVFYQIDDAGTKNYQSVYDVLAYLCQRFGLRLYLSNGVWRIEQIGERDNSSIRERKYTKAGTYLSNVSVGYNITLDQSAEARMRGGFFEWYPALREVTETYNHRTRTNHLAGAAWTDASSPTFTSDISVTKSGNTTLQISGIHSRTLSILTGYVDGNNIVGVWGLTLSVGSYYLRRDIAQIQNGNITYTSTEWVDYPSEYKIVYNYAAYNFPAIGESVTLPGTISITTPGIEESGNITAEINYLNHRKLTNGNIIDNTTISVGWSFSQMNLQVYTNGNPADISDKSIYKVTGPATGNTAKLDFSNIIGDGVDTNSVGKLEVQDSGGFWTDSSQWRVGTTGSYATLSNLFLTEILGLQKTNTRRYLGRIKGSMLAHSRIQFDGNLWMLTNGSFEARRDEWQGTWFAIARSVTFLTPQSPTIVKEPIGSIPTIITSTPIMVPPNTSAAVGNALSSATVRTAISSGSVTSVAVNQTLAANAFTAGDQIAVVNTQTGATLNLTVSANTAAGDTTVAVSGYSTADFPEGSPVIYLPQNNTTQSGSGSATATTNQSNWWEIFQQWYEVDNTNDPDWPIESPDISIEKDGFRIDGDGIQSFQVLDTTPGVKIGTTGDFYLNDLSESDNYEILSTNAENGRVEKITAQKDWFDFFRQWWSEDETNDVNWPIEAPNIVMETDENAGNGATAGIRFDGNGIRSYNASSSDVQSGIATDGSMYSRDFNFEDDPLAGVSTDGIRLDSTNGLKGWKSSSTTPTFYLIPSGAWEARSSGNAGNGTTAGVMFSDSAGFKSWKSTSSTPVVLLSHTGQIDLRTTPNVGNGTTAGVEFDDTNGLRAFKSTSSTPTVHIKTDGTMLFSHGGHPTVSAGIMYVNGGVLYMDNGSGTKVHAQFGHIREFQPIGFTTAWTTGVKSPFFRVTSQYTGFEVYQVGYSVGDTAGSGAGSNQCIVYHQTASGVTTTIVSTMTCDTAAVSNIVTATNVISLAQGDVFYFNVSSVKATPAQGLYVELYLRKT